MPNDYAEWLRRLPRKDYAADRAKAIRGRRKLLIELERIVGESFRRRTSGDRCRFSVTFKPEGGKVVKLKRVPDNMSDEAMMGGQYCVGRDDIEIFEALNRALERI